MAGEEAVGTGAALRASEDEDEDEGAYDVERRHRQLLEAVSSLAGRNRRKLTERTEASAQVSEFGVSCEGTGEKLILSDLLGPIKSSSLLGIVKKQLNRVKQKKAVELPLSKREAQRVVREAAYDKTSKAITKWDQVVLQNRRAEQLVFPLKQEQLTVASIEEKVTSWQARTPLEQEIFSLLHKTRQLTTDPLLTLQEEASLQAMSLEEVQQRRAELQKARALQSYYEAKARREKKIKSKKFHRVLQKNKRREALKEFEALKKSNPEAALLKLDEMEKARIKERMSLKHQNKGKWARSRAIMGKYDLEARRAMQEQLAKNKELTQKVCLELEGDKEVCVAEESLLPDSLNEVQPSRNVANPWMLGKLSNETKDSETQEDLKAPADLKEPESEGEEEPVLSEEEALLQDFEQRRWARHCQKGSPEPQGASRKEELPESVNPSQAAEQINMEDEQKQEEPLLSEQLGRLCAMEEMDVLASEDWAEEQKPRQPARTEQQKPHQDTAVAEDRPRGSQTTRKTAKQKMIDLQAVLAGESCMIHCPTLPVAVQDEGGGTDQRLVIKEAFAGDDVVADFLKEKNKVEQEGKSQTVDLLLPGWGEWSGTGLKPSAKKRKRFLIKQPPGPPRKDRHLPHVIISQKRNILAATHQVNELPFPFDSHQQFERSIQAPIGPMWNTQHAFQKLTAPHLITQPGHIIQPISNEDVASQSTTSTRKAKPAMELTPQQAKRLHQHSRKKVR